MYRNEPQGFTLIELVITMGLIAILSAGTLSVLGQGPQKYARDSRRKADLQSIASALELYRNDHSGYPIAGNYPSGIQGTYMNTIPKDPKKSTLDYAYTPGNCGPTYCSTFSICTNSSQPPESYGEPLQYCVYNP